MDINSIVYVWEFPYFKYYQKDKSTSIIIDVILFNCKQNLTNYLIETNLVSNIDLSYIDFGMVLFMVSLVPNVDYKKSVMKINDIIRYYFNNLSNFNWKKIYNYVVKSYELNYNNSSKDDNMNLATSVSLNMHYYNEENLYNGPKIVLEKNINKIFETLELLKFDKTNIFYITKNKLCNEQFKLDKYYKKQYCKLEKSLIPVANNKYNFNISINEDILNIKPVVIKNLDKYNKPIRLNSRFWYGAASKFNEPLVSGTLLMHSHKLFNTIRSSLVTSLALSVINYYIKLIFCSEIDIGYIIKFSKNSSLGYISLVINGFNDNYINIFNRVINEIRNIKPSSNIIKSDIKLLKNILKNINKSSPWEFQSILLDDMINKYNYDYNKELEEINNIDEHMIIKRINQIIKFDNLPIITVIYGNINKDSLKNIVTYNMNSNVKIDKKPAHILPKNIYFKNPNKDEVNNSVGYIFPIETGYNNFNLTARMLILNIMMERPAFDELRTKAQLGYLVSCKVLSYSDLFILKITVQSAKEVKYIETKINEFLEFFYKYMDSDEVDFKQVKNSIYELLSDKVNNMSELIINNVSEIQSQDYLFDRKKYIRSEIKKITLNDIKKLYHSIIKNKIKIIVN
jgi:insulysin